MNNLQRVQIADGVHFNSIYDDRFKTSLIAVVMAVPLDKETVSPNALVPGILTRSCKAYPTYLELSRKLDSLYGASLGGSSKKCGEMQIISISAGSIDDRYSLDGEPVFEKTAELLCSALFEPNAKNGEFDNDTFKNEQTQLIDSIDAQFNDKRIYANLQMSEVMFAAEKYGINRLGTKEQALSLTPKAAFDAYENLLKTARIEIMCLGSSDSENIKKMFEEKFSSIERSVSECTTQIIRRADTIKKKTDNTDVVQSKLIMGFRTDCAEPEETVSALKLMCAVLGGTAHSKLFNNVREKLSLCYYCVSRTDSVKGVLTVESGVEKENIEKTKAAVLRELDDMKNGIITDDEIDNAKRSLNTAYLSVTDSLSQLQGWYINRMLIDNFSTPEQEAEKINAVTKEQIIEAAQKLTLDTVYVLTGTDETEGK